MMKHKIDRTQRIGDMIQQSLANILLQHAGDERFQHVTITGINVARDLSYAKVFVSILLDDNQKIKEVIQALNRAANFFRYQLAQAIQLRIVPALKFHYDASTANGFKLTHLINDSLKSVGKEVFE